MTGSGKFGYPHRNKTYRSVTGILVMYLCLFMTACSLGPKKIYDWPAQEGVVINKETGEPIAGAWVTGRWEGYVMGQGVCFHTDATQTDEQGRFVFPAWRNREGNFENSTDQQFVTDVYAPGYRDVGGYTLRCELVPFAGGREERLDYIGYAIADCNEGGYSRRTYFPLLKTIYLEAKSLSKSPEEIRNLDWFRKHAASYAVAVDGENVIPYSSESEQEGLKRKIIMEELQ